MSSLTPEEDNILRHHPASPAADKIRAERAKAEWNERAAAEQAKQGAAYVRIKDLEAKIASNVAEAAARDMRIAELERDLSAKFASLKIAYAALNEICKIVEWGTPACPQDAVEGVRNRMAIGEGTIARAEQAEEHRNCLNQRLETINFALDDAGAPMLYTGTTDPNGIPIPDPERIRLLGERVRGEHAERIREGDNVQVYRDRLAAAERALDDRDAPRFADGAPLSPAARIRALPR